MPSAPPAPQGYRMPAEWEPHSATWLAWPHNTAHWEHYLAPVQQLYIRLIAALQAQERVHLLVNDAAMARHVRARLAAAGVPMVNVVLHLLATVDVWLRDTGPLFLTPPAGTAQPLAVVDWVFNAWGNKYPEMLPDDALPQRIATLLGLPCFHPGIVLEGGAIDVNGRGSCLVTEQCLLHPNRNPRLSRQDLEQYLCQYLGVRHVIWLGAGLVGDDTDGHVDQVVRFVTPRTVVCALEPDPQDANYAALQENYRRLQRARDEVGRPLEVIPLPMPGPIVMQGERLPASYANFYVANGMVLVPTYDHPHDHRVLALFQRLFPQRRVLAMPCGALIWGQGALHCITQPQPALSLP